jgi:prepilin-type N-terminal cleavage/methylation domain-containing protein/prepilin-type processing-associated H-X9-DG protein
MIITNHKSPQPSAGLGTKGFTLIELLVVISIIAVLLAVLMPALNKARELGQRAVCLDNLKEIMQANEVYATKHDGWYAPVVYDMRPSGGDSCEWFGMPDFRLALNVTAYETTAHMDTTSSLIMPLALSCPADKIIKNPSANTTQNVLISYAYNYTDWKPNGGWLPGAPYSCGWRSEQINHPAEKLAFVDSIDWWCWWGGANYAVGWDKFGQANISVYKHNSSPEVDGPTIYRHNEGANIAFYDCHTEWRKRFDIYVRADVIAAPQRPGIWENTPRQPPVTGVADPGYP